MVKQKSKKKCQTQSDFPAALSKGCRSRISLLFNDSIEEKHLEAAISHLRHKVNERRRKIHHKEHCLHKDYYCSSTASHSVKYMGPLTLKARQALYLSDELRKALLLHDWDSAVKLLLLLISTGIKCCTVPIVKACLVLMFNHPMATPQLALDFIRKTTGYAQDSDVEDFVLLMFAIRHTLLPPTKGGTFIRSTSHKKVTQDPEYTLINLKKRVKKLEA